MKTRIKMLVLFIVCLFVFNNGVNAYINNSDFQETIPQVLYSIDVKQKLLSALESLQDEFYIEDINSRFKIFKIMADVLNENPQIFYVDVGKTTLWGDGRLKIGYCFAKDAILKMKADLDNTVESVVESADKIDGVVEREKFVYGYVIKEVAYLDKYDNEDDEYLSHTAYGALVSKKAVCNGYSKALKLFLNRLGIECSLVMGRYKGVSHVWNVVNINGIQYQLDATLDDCEDGSLQFKYFNCSEKDILLDHEEFW